MEFMVYLIFFIVIVMFIVTLVRNISEWNQNNHSPRLSVDATVVTKRMRTHAHNHNGHIHHTHSYYVTFEVQSGDRMELHVSGREYGMLAEGDFGVLSFQGTRYLGFERKT